MKKMRRISILLAAVLFLAAVCPSVCAASRAENVIRVGFFAFPGYHVMEDSGRRSGYGYEFLQRLAVHGGWTYEYAGYEDSYADSLEMLRRGEVDVVTSVTKTPEREKEFLFSDQSIGVNSTIFTIKAGRQDIVEGDYATYDGITVGMLEENSKNANFERFAETHGFTFRARYFSGQDELSQALQDGTVDAAVTGSLRLLGDEWLLESFDASPFYICTRIDRADLMAEINAAINEMDLHDPNWRDELHDIYYSAAQDGSIILNAEESAFLEELRQSGRTIKLLFNPDRIPYCYFRDGEARGILPAIFETLAERLSLAYEFVPVEDREEYFKIRESETADVVLDFIGDFYLAEEENFKITVPYFQTSFARLTLDGFAGDVQNLAMMERSEALKDYIFSRYPNEALVRCDSCEACVDCS